MGIGGVFYGSSYAGVLPTGPNGSWQIDIHTDAYNEEVQANALCLNIPLAQATVQRNFGNGSHFLASAANGTQCFLQYVESASAGSSSEFLNGASTEIYSDGTNWYANNSGLVNNASYVQSVCLPLPDTYVFQENRYTGNFTVGPYVDSGLFEDRPAAPVACGLRGFTSWWGGAAILTPPQWWGWWQFSANNAGLGGTSDVGWFTCVE